MISSFYERLIGGSPPPRGVNKPKILCVGLACVDIVQTVEKFPSEDTDSRCLDYRWQRGGNASNNCTVLSQLGTSCEFLGTLSSGHYSTFLKDDMRKYSIDFSNCPQVEAIGCPMSTVILSLTTGSRTILHHNPNLPELTLQNFEQLHMDDYSWIHFEGRNIPRVLAMMQHIENYNDSLKLKELKGLPLTISVELEKQNSELLDLLPYADVAFISKEFSCSRGYSNMSETLRSIAQHIKSGATIICAWGDRGAMARTRDGTIVQSPAFPPHKIIDTLGAGDTFTAATLHYLNTVKLASDKCENNTEFSLNEEESTCNMTETCNQSREIIRNKNIESLESSKTTFINQTVLQSAITFACRIAGTKIGFRGYDDLQYSTRNFCTV